MTKLLLCDLDGTLRCPKSGANFINDPYDQQLIPEAATAIAHYHNQGWKIIGITNQGGVAAGHKSLEDAIAEQKYTLELLPELSSIFFCTDFEGRHCWFVCQQSEDYATCLHLTPWAEEFIGKFRKPNPGMLLAAIKLSGSEQMKNNYCFVGDRPEDEQAAKNAGVDFMWAEDWRK